MPGVGVEPTCPFGPLFLRQGTYTNSVTRAYGLEPVNIEDLGEIVCSWESLSDRVVTPWKHAHWLNSIVVGLLEEPVCAGFLNLVGAGTREADCVAVAVDPALSLARSSASGYGWLDRGVDPHQGGGGWAVVGIVGTISLS